LPALIQKKLIFYSVYRTKMLIFQVEGKMQFFIVKGKIIIRKTQFELGR